MDSTCATSGIDNFAICLSISDGGGLIDGDAFWDVFVCCGGTGFSTGVRVANLSPSNNSLTVSAIFGGDGIAGVGCRGGSIAGARCGDSGIFNNGGAETCGVDDF